MSKAISGFSKMSKSKKIDWITDTYFTNKEEAQNILKQYWNSNEKLQQLHDEFIENTISNYYLPFGVAPNFLINACIRDSISERRGSTSISILLPLSLKRFQCSRQVKSLFS